MQTRARSAGYASVTSGGSAPPAKRTGMVPLAQLLAEADSTTLDEEPELSQEELTSIYNYGNAQRAIKRFKEEAKIRTAGMRKEASDLRTKIDAYLSPMPVPILRITSGGTAADGSEIPQFVRHSRNNSSQQLTVELVYEAIRRVTKENVMAIIARWSEMRDKKHLTDVDAFVQCIVDNLRELRTSYKDQVVLCSHVPKGIQAHVVPMAPPELVDLCGRLHTINETLRRLREDRKKVTEGPQAAIAESRPIVEDTFDRHNLRSQPVSFDGEAFFLRRKVKQTKASIKVATVKAQLLKTISENPSYSLEFIISKIDDFADIVISALDQPLVTQEIITLDKAPQRGKRNRSGGMQDSGDSDSDEEA